MSWVGAHFTEIVFWAFGGLAVVSAMLCITRRSPVASALWLIQTLFCLAVLFTLLGAPFLGVLQVLVYAGAIMVLFLFVIMLLDLKAEERRRIRLFGVAGGSVSVLVILFIFFRSLLATKPGGELAQANAVGDTATLGRLLFTDFLLPFEIVSVLLLVAMVGVVLLSKKDLK